MRSTCENQGSTSLQLNYPQHKTENCSVEILVRAMTVGQPSFFNNKGKGLQSGSWHCCLCPGSLRINRGPCSSNLSHKVNIFFLDLTGNAWACNCLRSGLQHCSGYLPHSLEFQSHLWSNLLRHLFYTAVWSLYPSHSNCYAHCDWDLFHDIFHAFHHWYN